jgi:large conductance mechanosensitive channel
MISPLPRLPVEEVMTGLKKFLLRGNVVDLAVAVVIGAAFGAVVAGFSTAFVTPLVGLVTGVGGDVREKTFTVSGTTFPYGQFIDAALGFVIVAAVVYFLVVLPVQRLMDRFKTEPEAEAPVRECAECMSKIPGPARRCAFCGVAQPASAEASEQGPDLGHT